MPDPRMLPAYERGEVPDPTEALRCADCGVALTTQDALAGEVVEDDDGLHHRECFGGDVAMIVEPKDPPDSDGSQAAAYAEQFGLVQVSPGVFCADEKSLADARRMVREYLDTPLDPDRR